MHVLGNLLSCLKMSAATRPRTADRVRIQTRALWSVVRVRRFLPRRAPGSGVGWRWSQFFPEWLQAFTG
eukprot:GSA120T00009579001.1